LIAESIVIQTLHGGFLSHGGTHLYHPFLFGIFHETNHPSIGIHSPGQSYRVLPHWASAAAWGRAARQRGAEGSGADFRGEQAICTQTMANIELLIIYIYRDIDIDIDSQLNICINLINT